LGDILWYCVTVQRNYVTYPRSPPGKLVCSL
jgi:hypothetical protein